jgi:hypothetical protein
MMASKIEWTVSIFGQRKVSIAETNIHSSSLPLPATGAQ